MAVYTTACFVLGLAAVARSNSASISFSSSITGQKPVAVTLTKGPGAQAEAGASNPLGGIFSFSSGDESHGTFETLLGSQQAPVFRQQEQAPSKLGTEISVTAKSETAAREEAATIPRVKAEEVKHSLYTVFVPAAKYGLPPSAQSAPPAPGAFLPPDGALLAPPPPVVNNIPLPAPRKLTYFSH